MPQIDFESIVPVSGGDRKVACELEGMHEFPPDFPPDSFWLSEDAEFDWFDRNAVLDRKDSAKGNFNMSTNNLCANNVCSQRFTTRLVSKSSIISLPKPNISHIDASRRRSKKCKTLLPKRNESVVRSLVEPPSPMVSCIGRVRSNCGHRTKTEPGAKPDVRPPGGKPRRKKSRWIGLFQRIMRMFFPHRMIKSEPSIRPELQLKSPSTSSLPGTRSGPAVVEGLGGMTRFASGRRSSWSTDDFHELAWHS